MLHTLSAMKKKAGEKDGMGGAYDFRQMGQRWYHLMMFR